MNKLFSSNEHSTFDDDLVDSKEDQQLAPTRAWAYRILGYLGKLVGNGSHMGLHMVT